MASEGGSAMPRRDPAWKYCSPIENMHPNERDAYRSTVHASKASDWEREQHENIVGSKHKTRESSTGITADNAKITDVEMGIEPPSPYEIKNKYLEMEYKEMETYVNNKEKNGRYMAQMRKYCGGDIVRPGATRRGVGSDPELLQAVYDVFAKLDPTTESLGQFGNELVLFRDAKEDSVIERQLQQAEWWFMYGNETPTLGKLAIKVLSQTALSFAYERNWSTFALIHTKQRNCLAYPRLEQLVFCYYNMRLNLRDMEAENDRVAEKDYLDLLDISTEVGEEEDNQLFQWVRPIHLDDEVGNPDPRIAAHAREFGVNVERVLSEEVHSESFSKNTDDSLQAALNSHQEIDSTSAGHSSRPSAACTSTSGYDGSRGGIDDGGDNGGEDIDERQHSQYPINQFTCENDFTHCTLNDDHDSRRAGPDIKAIEKPYRGRERMMEPYNEGLLLGSFESMSIGTQFSDSSNEANVYPPHVMSYDQPSSSTDEVFGYKAFSHVPKEWRLKLEDKALTYIFVGYGYEEFRYMLWDLVNRKIIKSRNVIFHEDHTFVDINSIEKSKDLIGDSVDHTLVLLYKILWRKEELGIPRNSGKGREKEFSCCLSQLLPASPSDSSSWSGRCSRLLLPSPLLHFLVRLLLLRVHPPPALSHGQVHVQPDCTPCGRAWTRPSDDQRVTNISARAPDNSGGLEVECSICISMFQEGERVKVLPQCRHAFHSQCVDKWLMTHSSCPLCRTAILRGDSLAGTGLIV
ncbi:Retrovirus-related Pol polyprotein from transposon TNT 1-94 [Vitis vinifera]|uniref:Retrovirus-related Pol polyprotein from transposon TNT 1-94 n=1 Tax=Vitis vinifera TaxID=29760 RepID=A0A438HHP9_VITVI|nr:Retrovirus-related Pol polyprotein from transposon TNT 1-94 [Vitis vinifera]